MMIGRLVPFSRPFSTFIAELEGVFLFFSFHLGGVRGTRERI